ncbi:MAG: hypothetical protein ACERKY_09650 [Anaerolineales bacterium]
MKILTTVKKVVDVEFNEVARKEYGKVQLQGGRTVRYLEPYKPEGLKEGYYFMVYEIR